MKVIEKKDFDKFQSEIVKLKIIGNKESVIIARIVRDKEGIKLSPISRGCVPSILNRLVDAPKSVVFIDQQCELIELKIAEMKLDAIKLK